MNIDFSLLLFKKKTRAAHNLEQFCLSVVISLSCFSPLAYVCVSVCLCDVFESLVIETIRICLGKKQIAFLLLSFFFVFRRHLTLVVHSSFLAVVIAGCIALLHIRLTLSLSLCLLLLSLLFSFFFSSIVATKFIGIVATTVANSFVYFVFLCMSSIGFRFLIRVVLLTCH